VNPAIVLGTDATALAVTRSLGRRGVPVILSGPQGGIAACSRYCSASHEYAKGYGDANYWRQLLLARETKLAGSVLLTSCDAGLDFIARNHEALRSRYLLDMHAPELHLALLDKQRTLELGRAAGVATPSFWSVAGKGELERALDEVRYPALLKPIHSHLFRAHFGRKHFIARDADELAKNASTALQAGMAFMVCEMIPGPDSLLSSYYTYITPEGEALFQFTKRILRRYPANEGGATYHITEWLPSTAEAGEKFFRGIGFRGLGNVEFKLDRRDGTLKLIECNSRFTAAQALVNRAGVDSPWIAYRRATGAEVPRIESYRKDLCLWNPKADWDAFRQLRREGKLTTAAWLRSLARRKLNPYFEAQDPLPWVVVNAGYVGNAVARLRRPFAPLTQRVA
jgi:D-aspartate ligase